MTKIPTRDEITVGSTVSVETKEDQGTGKLTTGKVLEILTASKFHPHGIKVRLDSSIVGRVKKILTNAPPTIEKQFVDLSKREVPKTEDTHNEFKEFYQYDKQLSDTSDVNKIKGIKSSVRHRLVLAICSFGNSKSGGFVYLGINSDGGVSGLEKDRDLEGFTDYEDAFANHIRDTLGALLKDKSFIISKLQIKFRSIEDKTICIIQVLPAIQPLYINGDFYVRGPTPRAEKLGGNDMIRYIKDRFPNFE